MTGQVSLYNPRATPPEQLEAMLVGRDALLKEVLDNLREQARARTRQHWLLRGPRGMGKTHLTGIIHHRVREDAELSRTYLPLWLGEADVYEVYSPATLLERIAERLVEVCPEAGLGAALRTLEGVGDEEGLFQELVRLLSQEAERQQKTLLVLMENLDALLEGFAPKEREAQLRQLRSLLLHDPHFLFISTTPTRYLAELTDPKKPLYNQFKERSLKPLTVDEVGTVFSKLAVLTGRHAMEQVLGTGQDAALRRKVIHQLTGGLPRSVVMAFGVMQDRSGIPVLVEDLRKLLDAQTAYFEARLARLAPRERAIVTAMALASENLTLKEIAGRSRLPEKTLSTLISRLVQDGHVEITAGSGGRGTVYGLSEGLFRLWYQYRKGRLLLEPLVRLLAYLFNPTELQDTISKLKQRLSADDSEARDSARMALHQAEEALRLATSEEGRRDRERLWSECVEDAQRAWATAEHGRLVALINESTAKPLFDAQKAQDIPYAALIAEVLNAAASLPEPMARDCVDTLQTRLLLLGNSDAQVSETALTHLANQLKGRTAPSFRSAEPFVDLSLSLVLGILGRYEEGLRHTDEALRHATGTQRNKYNISLELGLWYRANLLEQLKRIPEAILTYKQFVQKAIDENLILRDAGFKAAHRLLTLCTGTDDEVGEEYAVRALLQLASTDLDADDRDVLGYAKLRLIVFRMERGELPPPALLDALEQWLRDYPTNSFSEMAQETYQELKPVTQAWAHEDPKVAAEIFLAEPTHFYLYLEPHQVRSFLDRLVERLTPELVAPIRIHQLISDALSGTASRTLKKALKEPATDSRLQEALGRLPPELRQTVQEFIEHQRARRDMRSTPTEDSGIKRRRKQPY